MTISKKSPKRQSNNLQQIFELPPKITSPITRWGIPKRISSSQIIICTRRETEKKLTKIRFHCLRVSQINKIWALWGLATANLVEHSPKLTNSNSLRTRLQDLTDGVRHLFKDKKSPPELTTRPFRSSVKPPQQIKTLASNEFRSLSKTTGRQMGLSIQAAPLPLSEPYRVRDSWLRIIRVSQKEVICLPRKIIQVRCLQPEIQHLPPRLCPMLVIQHRKGSMGELSIRGRGEISRFRPMSLKLVTKLLAGRTIYPPTTSKGWPKLACNSWIRTGETRFGIHKRSNIQVWQNRPIQLSTTSKPNSARWFPRFKVAVTGVKWVCRGRKAVQVLQKLWRLWWCTISEKVSNGFSDRDLGEEQRTPQGNNFKIREFHLKGE